MIICLFILDCWKFRIKKKKKQENDFWGHPKKRTWAMDDYSVSFILEIVMDIIK